ncbi:hypothetical protein [Photobacterium leiognathi]|uniref:hypothetical protein n=1 Tax=Photobacterium leiognathi TaxID=553611 RepID=UPI002981C426|nr:hypothetical protein [Photobacterium leiognathi]
MTTHYYGLINRAQALETAIAVNDCIAPSSGKYGVAMILETCAAETLLGTHKDRTDYAAGTSIAQIDNGTFIWLRDKYGNHPVNERIKELFDIDISRVQYFELEHNPLLGMIWCRLRYLPVKGSIPETLKGRADYWKKWYNSTEGKGTPEGYMQKVEECAIARLTKRLFM